MVKLFELRKMGVAAAALFAFLSTGDARAHAPSDPKAVATSASLVGQSNLIARARSPRSAMSMRSRRKETPSPSCS